MIASESCICEWSHLHDRVSVWPHLHVAALSWPCLSMAASPCGRIDVIESKDV